MSLTLKHTHTNTHTRLFVCDVFRARDQRPWKRWTPAWRGTSCGWGRTNARHFTLLWPVRSSGKVQSACCRSVWSPFTKQSLKNKPANPEALVFNLGVLIRGKRQFSTLQRVSIAVLWLLNLIWLEHWCRRKKRGELMRSRKTVLCLWLSHVGDKAPVYCQDCLLQTAQQIKSYNWLTLHWMSPCRHSEICWVIQS